MTLPPSELPCHQGAVKRASFYRTLTFVASVVVGSLIALAACSNQGEGERCEIANGNDDCKTSDGLICYDGTLLNGKPSGARCCPSDRSKSTVAVCMTSIDISGGDATAPADTGPPSIDTGDAGDAGSDAHDGSISDADSDANATDAADGG